MSPDTLLEQIERALRAGRVITVVDKTLRYCKRGQDFSDGDQRFQALATGVFLRMPVFEGRTAWEQPQPDSYTWCFYTQVDDLGLVLKEPISKLTDRERDAISVGFAFTAAMASLREDKMRLTAPAGGGATFEQFPSISGVSDA